MLESVSYRLDAINMTFITDSDDFKKAFSDRGYELREPYENEAVRLQKGYHKEEALMLDIQVGEKDNEIFTLTIQTRYEKNGNQSGFMAISGEQLDYIPYEDIIKTYSDWVKGTRVDIAVDLAYDEQEHMEAAQVKLCKRVGFDPKRGVFTQSAENDISGGKKNIRTPLKTASMIVSKGLTLYIGARQSKFMVRAYDKSAEVMSKTGEEIDPTLRIEIEAKQEIANGVIRKIINSDKTGHELAPSLWHTISEDYIAFKKRVNTETLSEVMKINKAEVIELDYSKIQGIKLEYEQWVRSQVSPKYQRLYGDTDLEEKIKGLGRMGYLSSYEIKRILEAIDDNK